MCDEHGQMLLGNARLPGFRPAARELVNQLTRPEIAMRGPPRGALLSSMIMAYP